jgi:hypothetical protein
LLPCIGQHSHVDFIHRVKWGFFVHEYHLLCL